MVAIELKMKTCGLLLATLLLTSVLRCSVVGGKCPNDDDLRSSFLAKRQSYEQLLAMINEDSWAVSYVGKGEVEAKASKLSADRKREYLNIAKEIGSDFITQNDGDMIVWHWSSAKSLTSVSKYKGIAYFQKGKKHNYITKDKLDRLEDGNEDGIWVSHLSGQWCIIYMQSD